MDKPDLYDPKINRSYAELAAHYDTLVDPARAFKPKDKPRVERPMPYVRDSYWRGRTFTSLQAMQAEAVRWSREVAGTRSSRPLDGAAPAVVFAAVEAPALRTLPVTPFVLATWSTGNVGPDIHLLTELRACRRRCRWQAAATVPTRGRKRRHSGFGGSGGAGGGALLEIGNRWQPYRLVDPIGDEVTAATAYFRDLQAAGRSEATVRSYGMDLLRWYRFLWAIGVPWERACRVEARDFCRWLLIAGRPARVGRGKASRSAAGTPYSASVRAHSETVLRCFYDFHRDVGTGPLVNPFPLERSRRGGRAHAHHNPMEPYRDERAGLYRPRLPARIPRSISDEQFNEIFARLPSHGAGRWSPSTCQPVSAGALRDLAALRWLDAGQSVILYGPVGVGKTHIAQALGHNVIRRGGQVRFLKTSRVLADLAGGHADRTWERRQREYTRPAVLILDDFAMRELTGPQADDLYELVSERAAQTRPLILTSNRAPADWYALFPNPVVAESLLDRLINTSHQVLMDGPSYRPRKRPPARRLDTKPETGVDTTKGHIMGNCIIATPGELRDRRQARSNGSTAPWNRNGPTPAPTAPSPNASPRSPTSCTPTITTAAFLLKGASPADRVPNLSGQNT